MNEEAKSRKERPPTRQRRMREREGRAERTFQTKQQGSDRPTEREPTYSALLPSSDLEGAASLARSKSNSDPLLHFPLLQCNSALRLSNTRGGETSPNRKKESFNIAIGKGGWSIASSSPPRSKEKAQGCASYTKAQSTLREYRSFEPYPENKYPYLLSIECPISSLFRNRPK